MYVCMYVYVYMLYIYIYVYMYAIYIYTHSMVYVILSIQRNSQVRREAPGDSESAIPMVILWFM